MRILSDNYSLTSTFSSTGTNTSYPLANLKSPFLEEIWKGLDADETITINFGTSKPVDCVYLGYTNATSITVKLYNSSDVLLYTIAVSAVSLGAVFSTVQSVRYATVRLQSGETVYCGNIGIGDSYVMPNPIMGVVEKPIDNSIIIRNAKGQTLKNKIPVLRGYDLSFGAMLIDSYNEVKALITDMDTPVWVDIYEQAHAKIPPVYALVTIDKDPSQSWGRYACSIKIEEAR
jgi:hypothetical protein